MSVDPGIVLNQFVIKATARCNLDCSYCYVFNRRDQSWRTRTRAMSDEVFAATVERIRRHCLVSGQTKARLLFHGGEPLLVGPRTLEKWIDLARSQLGPVAEVRFAVQTNGTLITDRWARLLVDNDVEVGISLDGPPEINDAARVDHAGRGSHRRVVDGVEHLRAAGAPINILTVVPLGAPPDAVLGHLTDLRPNQLHLLLPDHHHGDIAGIRERFGPTPVADFLVPAADAWLRADGSPDIPLFRNVCRLLLGATTRSDTFGNPPLSFVFVEVDGEIEGLDVLRAVGEGLSSTGLDIRRDDFRDIQEASDFHRRVIFSGMPIPQGCRSCPERSTCAGGYLPHRYSADRGFDNPSVWCDDILVLFGHLRRALGVDADETRLRRKLLDECARNRPWVA